MVQGMAQRGWERPRLFLTYERAYGHAMTYTALPLPTITDAHRTATKDRLGGSRIAAIVRGWHAIDPRCVTCGTATHTDGTGTPGDKATFGHVIPASVVTPGATGGARGGYTADNSVLQCADCQHAIADTVVERVLFVPAYFGTFPIATRTRRVESTDAKGAARVALGYAR